ncbi:MAG TPA: hypothetical protein VKZ53_30820 [Candidatus Angelobacter sp.]|nr:hypothetical protein [Candidatus Angelobacter sp.]
MRVVQRLCLVLLISSLMAAQSSAPSGDGASNVQSDVQKLLDAVTAQQKALADQQKQISEQQQEIERLKQQLGGGVRAVSANGEEKSAHVMNAVLNVPSPTAAAAKPASDYNAQDAPRESPLSFRIGGAEFTPGGFLDFTGIFRSTGTGNLGTNFFNIPFNTTPASQLTETRFTAQNSRFNLKATSKVMGFDVTGFIEADFLGNDAGNVFVTSNGHTARLRHYFVDLRKGGWEFLAGQDWGWLTPNRVGVSPYSADVNNTLDMDFNYQVGLTWTRAPQFRAIYHPDEHWALGVALENPQQFSGQGQVTFPAAFANQVGGQLDNAANPNIANLHPDIIPKIAYDTDMSGKHFHAEVAGLVTSVKIATTLNGTPGTFNTHSKTGGGVSSAINWEFLKGIRFVANGFLSDGGGRYVFGDGPDAVVLPAATGAAVANDVRVSLVHSGSGILGFEAQLNPKTLFYTYYGGVYYSRNFALDNTVGAKANTFIGYGGPGSANSNNKSIQEPTFGWIQTFWKQPQYGALQLITQYSYLTRAPWFVATNAPKNAHLSMGWVNLRYTLP